MMLVPVMALGAYEALTPSLLPIDQRRFWLSRLPIGTPLPKTT